MRMEYIKNTDGLDWYGDIPQLPMTDYEQYGERYVGEESDSWLLLKDFVVGIDRVCENVLDYGDVDYFDVSKCKLIKEWLEKRKQNEMSDRLSELYTILYSYVDKAVNGGVGVVIEL